MTKPEFQKLLIKCFYGDIDEKETFKQLEHLVDVSDELDKIKKALEQIKTLCDQRYFGCEGPEHNDFYVLDKTLQNIEEIVEKTLKKD